MIKINCSYDKMIDIESLKEHPQNNNKHPKKQVEVLAKLIKDLGMRSPIVVSNLSGCIIKGHGRLAALKLLDAKEVPVDFQDYENKLEEIRDLTADNRIASYAEFDLKLLDDSLKDLDLNFNEIDLEEFGIIDIATEVEEIIEDKEDEDRAEKLEILIKCRDEDELELLVFELQTKGCDYKVSM